MICAVRSGPPLNRPLLPVLLTAVVANRPVAIAPHVPPIPWTPNVSRESSKPNFGFRTTAREQRAAAPAPTRIDAIGVTNPAAGVMPTRPATAPEAAPRAVGAPRWAHSMNIQVRAAAAVAVFVATKATVLSCPAATALPALKPNQPNPRRPVPRRVIVRLWGRNSSLG